jgi:hypothetical protein
MKEIEKKDVPDVSGGISPEGGCFPVLPGYPTDPIRPFPDPVPDTTEALK